MVPLQRPTEAPAPERVWYASQEVLREHDYQLARVDRRAGVISTQPVTSQQFFEFWRHDVATVDDWAEASLRPIRRRVEVQIPPLADAARSTDDFEVRVIRECLSAPDRQFNSSIASLKMFSFELPSVETGRPVRPSDVEWIEDGRDAAMEAELRDMILARADVL